MKFSHVSLSLSALGSTLPASAAIVYSGPVNATADSDGANPGIYLNMLTSTVSYTGFEGADYSIFANNTAPEFTFGASNWSTDDNWSSYVKNAPRYSGGESIDSSLEYDSAFYQLQNSGATDYESDWDDGAPGYLGVRFGEAEEGPFNYGWVQLDLDPDTNSITLIDYAYESALDTSINAGAVPEPAHAAAVLALGAVGVAAYRRRKRA